MYENHSYADVVKELRIVEQLHRLNDAESFAELAKKAANDIEELTKPKNRTNYSELLDRLQSMYYDSDEPCDKCILMQAKNAIEDLLVANEIKRG